MASTLRRIVLFMFVCMGVGHPLFASVYGSVTIIGAEQSSNGAWDSGTVTITVNGHSETVSYGQFSTPASIASSLAVKFTKNCGCQGGSACARANGAEVIFKGKNGASIDSITVSSASSAGFGSSSFWGDTSRGSAGVTPRIDSLSPTSGKAGTQVVISGSGFGSAGSGVNLVTFNGEIIFTSNWTDTRIVITVPDDASSGEVIVTASGQASNGITFTVISDGASSPIVSGTLYSSSSIGYETNGNLTDFSDSIVGGWHFSYDSMNRLSAGTTNSAPYRNWGPYMCWFYDPFGNRTGESLSGTQCNASPAYTTYANYNEKNQVIGTTQASGGYLYDPAGNVLNDGINKYVYDGDGRLCAVQDLFSGATFQYIYDPEGNRIAKGTTNSLSCDSDTNGFNLTERYIVGQSGEQVSEVDGGGNWAHSNVYASGEIIATYDLSGLHFNLTDPLGTKRVQVLADLSAYENCTSLSFGNFLDCFGPSTDTGTDEDASEQHFAELEHDFESGLDHAMFREYSSMMGRWMSPDPYSGSYDFSNPQTLNRYAYVGNSPLAFNDPTGLMNSTETGAAGTLICGPWCGTIAVFGRALFDLFSGLFGGPSFHGSLKPRPTTGTPNWGNDPGSLGESLGLPSNGPPLNGSGLAAILGLPDAGCEFGACGPAPSAATSNGQAPSIKVVSYSTYQDILAMRAAFDAGIAALNEKGRIPLSGEAGGSVNNLWQCARAAVGRPMYGCGGQTLYMYGVMDGLHLNGNWTFNYIYNTFPPHQFIRATTPGGPSILIDAWKNIFEVTY